MPTQIKYEGMRSFILLCSLMFLSFVPPPAYSQEAEEPVEDPDVETTGAPTQQFLDTFKALSRFLTKRSYGVLVKKIPGTWVGTDISLVQLPSGIKSESFREVAAAYEWIPLPAIAAEISNEKFQFNLAFNYINTGPLKNTDIEYSTVNAGGTFSFDKKRQWNMGGQIIYSGFSGTRGIPLGANSGENQNIGVSSIGAEMNFHAASRDVRAGRKAGPIGLKTIGKLSLGYSYIQSKYVAPEVNTTAKYTKGVFYQGLGAGLCSATAANCLVIEVQNDEFEGAKPVITVMLRL